MNNKIDNLYYQKYNKYKNKYLALKQIAGSSNIPDDWEDEDFEVPLLNIPNMSAAAATAAVAATAPQQPVPQQPVVLILTFNGQQLPIHQDEYDLLVLSGSNPLSGGPLQVILENMVEFPDQLINGIPSGELGFLININDMIRIINMLRVRRIDYDISINYDNYKVRRSDTMLLFDIPDPRIRLNLDGNNQNVNHDYFIVFDFEGTENFQLKQKLNRNLEIKKQERVIFTFNGEIIDDIHFSSMRFHPFISRITEINIQQVINSINSVTREIIVKSLDLSSAGSLNDALRIIKYLKSGNHDYDHRISYDSYEIGGLGRLYEDSSFKDDRVVWSGNKTDAAVFARMNKYVKKINQEFLQILTNKLNKEIDISEQKRRSIENQENALLRKINKSFSDEPRRNRKSRATLGEEDYGYESADHEYESEISSLDQKIIAYKKDLEKLDRKSKSKKSRSPYTDLFDQTQDRFKHAIYEKHFGQQYKTQFPDSLFERLTSDERKFLKLVPNLTDIYYFTPSQESRLMY